MYADFLKVAEHAARVAGGIQMKHLGKPLEVEFKGEVDIVTKVDRLSEEAIVAIIRDAYPDHQIMAEEGTAKKGDSQYRWIIDPLDGTTNYAHAFPCFAVSIGLEVSGKVVAGVVYDPVRDECFTAVDGGGAYLNGRPIQVSTIDRLDRALLATGFPYDRREHADRYLVPFKNFLLKAQEVRRPGAASIDLCYLASGRIDGFWECKLHPWDVAAASVIVREAGGMMSDFSGNEYSVYGEETLASNGRIHTEMVEMLRLGAE
ncbi:MAG: inositol monophosphatase [Nitrospirae bacterium]|nr:inositol monophosphatase [Nitrospirota bacterium]